MLPPPPRPTLFPYTTPSDLGLLVVLHPADLGQGPLQIGVAAGAGVAEAHRLGLDAIHEDHPHPGEGVVIELAVGRLDQRSEEHTSELQSQSNLVCRLLLEKK